MRREERYLHSYLYKYGTFLSVTLGYLSQRLRVSQANCIVFIHAFPIPMKVGGGTYNLLLLPASQLCALVLLLNPMLVTLKVFIYIVSLSKGTCFSSEWREKEILERNIRTQLGSRPQDYQLSTVTTEPLGPPVAVERIICRCYTHI